MAAELGKVRLGNLTGTLILRMDDGSEVEVGQMNVPLDAMVTVVMPASAPVPNPPKKEHTIAELDGLAQGSVVFDRDGDEWTKRSDGRWRMDGGSVDRLSRDIIDRYGPITPE